MTIKAGTSVVVNPPLLSVGFPHKPLRVTLVEDVDTNALNPVDVRVKQGWYESVKPEQIAA